MNTYEKITGARKVLGLPEQATLEEIKHNYRELIKKHHPDLCPDSPEEHTKISARITSAYKTILAYCNQYKFSFNKEEVDKYLPTDEWWFERFGDDPLWGKKE